MPATEYPTSFLGRISIRRNQVISMDTNHEHDLQHLDLFHNHISDRFSDLLPNSGNSPSDSLLSIAWLTKLLDQFLCCDAQFKAFLITTTTTTRHPSPLLNRILPDFLHRLVKSMDISNSLLHSIESCRQFLNLAQIAVSALHHRPIEHGQVNRARRALKSLVVLIAVEDNGVITTKSTERAWSFGRRTVVSPKFRSLSWSMPDGWSAAKQIHAMSSNLVTPRGGGDSSCLPQAVYLMSTVLVFVMWSLVAALPCQDRAGLPITKFFPVIGLQEKIAEEWKKKEKRGSVGLLDEMQRIERVSRSLIQLTDSFEFSAEEVAALVAELSETCKKLEEGLLPLQLKIREVFHRIVKSRTEILELLCKDQQ